MRKLLPVLAAAIMLTVASCKQNACKGVVCNNGGYCEDGVCNCTSQWGGPNCDQRSNPCDTTACYNGGTCSSGICSCPAHTSGVDCRTLEAPNYMFIYRIAIGKFSPANSSGNVWDTDASAADIYPVIKKNGTVLFDGSGIQYRKDNANYTSWYPMLLGNDSVLIPDVTNNTYRMELWDYDGSGGGGGSDQLMNAFDFTPFRNDGNIGFPGSIDFIPVNGYDSLFEMHVYFGYRW